MPHELKLSIFYFKQITLYEIKKFWALKDALKKKAFTIRRKHIKLSFLISFYKIYFSILETQSLINKIYNLFFKNIFNQLVL